MYSRVQSLLYVVFDDVSTLPPCSIPLGAFSSTRGLRLWWGPLPEGYFPTRTRQKQSLTKNRWGQ